jgi:hypothetical protein
MLPNEVPKPVTLLDLNSDLDLDFNLDLGFRHQRLFLARWDA